MPPARPGHTGAPTSASIAETALSVRPAGPRSLLVEFDSLEQVLACHQLLTAAPLAGQLDAVPAARTLLLRLASRTDAVAAGAQLAEITLGTFSAGESHQVEIEVVYDGADLEELAAHLNLSREGLIDWHSGQPWTGAFGGFAPGFTYCAPQEEQRPIPRRSSPRTRVPEGAVAVAGEFSSVYPRTSPGGWQLIGRTPQRMWDLSRSSPALVRPGDTVRYRPVRGRVTATEKTREGQTQQADDDAAAPAQRPQHGRRPQHRPAGEPALTVTSSGLQSLIQDFGRPGFSNLGVGRAGVADQDAAHQANRLVGNAEGATVLEILNGGVRLLAERTTVLAVTGAETPLSITAEDGVARTPPSCAPFALLTAETLELGRPSRGIRSILAVRGGIAAEPVLGSVSTDTMSGLGPEPLEASERLVPADRAHRPVGGPEPSTLPRRDDDGTVSLRFTYGPRHDWFTAEEAWRLSRQSWSVTQESNRIGLRLDLDADDPTAQPLQRAGHGELPSEGVARGSLQMPPEGKPVLFLNDHPVTGGYPVLGVLIDEDLSAAAQLGPGDHIRFTAVDPRTLEPLSSAAQIPRPSDLRPCHPHPSKESR